MSFQKGFTLIELLVVIAIIGALAAIVAPSMKTAIGKAQYARTLSEFKSMALALELYYDDNGDYPPDTSRNIPPGLEPYLSSGEDDGWPSAPWPGSVYDWDNWADPDFPDQRIYQISVRFCPVGGPLSACIFPSDYWAKDFGIDSAAYYCVSGNCRAHISEPIDYPGYCVNCQP